MSREQAFQTSAGHRRWRRYLGSLLLLLVLGSAAFFRLGQADAAAQEAPATVAAVRGSVEKVVTAQGRLLPHEYVDVGAQVSGQLETLHVEAGSRVSKGQLLAEIDAAVQEARLEGHRAQLDAQRGQLAEARARLELAQLQFGREERLRAADATSEEAYQIARAALRTAEASVQVLRAQIRQTESNIAENEATLSYTRIYAPMDGVVVHLSAREGQTLNANQSAPILMRIADLSVMTVAAEVSEADVTRLRPGMPVRFSPLGAPDERWQARLRQILPTPTVSNNVVLYTVLFDVDNENGRLMSNMTAQVSFVEESARDVVTVPASSLKQNDGRYQVRVMRDGRAQWVDVEVGVSDRTVAEIRRGVAAGEPVVVQAVGAPGEGEVARKRMLRGLM